MGAIHFEHVGGVILMDDDCEQSTTSKEVKWVGNRHNKGYICCAPIKW